MAIYSRFIELLNIINSRFAKCDLFCSIFMLFRSDSGKSLKRRSEGIPVNGQKKQKNEEG